MSVTLGKGITPDVAIAGKPPGTKLIGWATEYIRSLALGICRHDLPNETNHGLVFTLAKDNEGKPRTSFPGSVQAKLAETAVWIIGLSAEEIEEARARTAP
jgi:hypothetical protein